MGGGDKPRCIPKDRVENMYRLEERHFASPVWPASLPVQQWAIDKDLALKEVQQQ